VYVPSTYMLIPPRSAPATGSGTPPGSLPSTGDNMNMFKALDATTPKTSNYIFGANINSILKGNSRPAIIPGSAAHGGRPGVGTNWPSNNAWDIFVRPGTPVYSVMSGKVANTYKSYAPPYIWGWQITISTNDVNGNLYTGAFYTHLDHLVVTKGQNVTKGDLIGFVGEFAGHSPTSDFHHLHMGLYNRKLHPGDLVPYPGPWSATLSEVVDLTGKLIYP